MADAGDTSEGGSVSGDREVLCAFFNCTNNAKKGARTPVWDRIRGLTSSVAHQDGWKCKDGWKSSRPMGEWYGVTTNAAGRVVGLDLQDNFISGDIPKEVGKLPALKKLDLSGNCDIGAIPPEIGDLPALEELNLSSCGLRGGIPKDVGKLKSLKKLDLFGNRDIGAIPPEIGDLPALEELNLSSCGLRGDIPKEFGKLKALKKLNLSHNRGIGAIPPEIGDLPALEELNLSDYGLQGGLGGKVGKLPPVKKIDPTSTSDVGGGYYGKIGKVPPVKKLDPASNSDLGGSIPPEHLNALEEVNLDNTGLQGDTSEFTVCGDRCGFVEVKLSRTESALMENITLINKVYKDDIIVRGERATYVIDTVIDGPTGRQFTGASIRYFVGYYDDLVMFDSTKEGKQDKEYEKESMGLSVVETCIPVVTPHDRTGIPHWEADGDFKAVWNGDGLWLETPLKHFSKIGTAWIWAIIGSNRGKMRSQPPPTSPSEAVENRPLRASKKFELARIIYAQNCTKETVHWGTLPSGTPAEDVTRSTEIAGGGNVGPVGIMASRAISSTRKREATEGATPTSRLGNHNCLGPGDMSVTSLEGHGSASILWYTLKELTPAQLAVGQPLIFGYNLERLQEDHGYIVDETSGKFVNRRDTEPDASQTYSRLRLVRILYHGTIHPGWYSRIHEEKLKQDGIKDFVVPFSTDVAKRVNVHYTTT